MTLDFEIIGKGNIGDKARQLINKTPKLKEIGFHVPIRTVLAEDFFDGFFQRNNLGETLSSADSDMNLELMVKTGSFTKEQFEALQNVRLSYGTMPLAVRSSAEGDSMGTGIYKSEFCKNETDPFKKAVKNVLASYFSLDAISFRRDAKTGKGFAINVEPIVGQRFMSSFGPMFSGFGYTSTSKGKGYISVVPGLGGGVNRRDGEILTREIMNEFNGNLHEYLIDCVDNKFRKIKRKSALVDFDSIDFFRGRFYGDAFYHNDVAPVSLDFSDELKKDYRKLSMVPLFDMMKKMEDIFGKAQYFEWALTSEEGKQKFHMLQIADANKKLDTLDFEGIENLLFVGNTVTGSGVKECYTIFNCENPDDREELSEFNRHNSNYILKYAGRLVSNLLPSDYRLRYEHFSNASVFLEIPDAEHVNNPISHLTGQLDMSGKFFGVLDYDFQTDEMWDRFNSRTNGKFYSGKMHVHASEKQDKIVIAALD